LQAEAVPGFNVEGIHLKLPDPSITLADFFGIMKPFLNPDKCREDEDDPDLVSIFDPIDSALEKASLGKDELDMVLFIGGSAQNPLVYEAIHNQFGRFVECVIGEDIRTPVSRGAAVHAFAVHGLEVQLIRSITSEPIYVITAGDNLTQILPAGTPMPSDEITFFDSLEVQHDGQEVVQLPICVTNRNKTLGMLEIQPPEHRPFERGESITMVCRIDENKLIQISAKAGSSLATTALLNPLANQELTPQEVRRLMSRQRLNEAIVKGGGKPTTSALGDYADACMEAEKWVEAAETMENLEKISSDHKTSGNATSICYAYSMAHREDRSAKWAETAFERNPTWVSAFNLALSHERASRNNEAETYFEKALDLSPDQPVLLCTYGERLLRRGEREVGQKMLEKALEIFLQAHQQGNLPTKDIWRVRKAVTLLDRNDLLDEIDRWEQATQGADKLYANEFLAAAKNADKTINPS
jgi:Flp pilus assembly protein TadD